MSQPTVTLDSAIAAFAASVRGHLDDLSAEDVDDLTGGLEADLFEEASDLDGRLDLDDPAAYAEELRASAGLPPRGKSRAPFRRRIVGQLDSLEAAIRRTARSTRAGAWLLDFAISLRAVWWVFRGWAAYVLGTWLLGGGVRQVPSVPPNLIQWALLGVAVIISVQWGRGKWVPGAFLKGVRVIVSIITIIAAPFLAGWALNAANSGSHGHTASADPVETGLWLDGQRVSNIFGYDADGNPISDLQLFDQNGDPLVSIGASFVHDEYGFLTADGNGEAYTVPHQGGSPGSGWNIYPLEEAPLSGNGEVRTDKAEPATPPFRTTYPVQVPSNTIPTPTPTPAPEAGR